MLQDKRLRDQVTSETVKCEELLAQVKEFERDISENETQNEEVNNEEKELVELKNKLSNTASKQHIKYAETDHDILRIQEQSKITDQFILNREASLREHQEELDFTKNDL